MNQFFLRVFSSFLLAFSFLFQASAFAESDENVSIPKGSVDNIIAIMLAVNNAGGKVMAGKYYDVNKIGQGMNKIAQNAKDIVSNNADLAIKLANAMNYAKIFNIKVD